MDKPVIETPCPVATLERYPGYRRYYRVTLPRGYHVRLTDRYELQSHWDWAQPGDRSEFAADHPARRMRPLVIQTPGCTIKLNPV